MVGFLHREGEEAIMGQTSGILCDSAPLVAFVSSHTATSTLLCLWRIRCYCAPNMYHTLGICQGALKDLPGVAVVVEPRFELASDCCCTRPPPSDPLDRVKRIGQVHLP